MPRRSAASELHQAAGVLFRLSPDAAVEPIGVGGWEGTESVPRAVLLAGRPLPPSKRDYGFGYANRHASAHGDPLQSDSITGTGTMLANLSETPSPTRSSDPYDGEDREGTTQHTRPNPSTGSRGRGRRPAHLQHPRVCISCGANKTPYWREAWSSTVLLCNACGLRYSKFRRRCLDCSYVPRKEDKGSRSCTKCGGLWS